MEDKGYGKELEGILTDLLNLLEELQVGELLEEGDADNLNLVMEEAWELVLDGPSSDDEDEDE